MSAATGRSRRLAIYLRGRPRLRGIFLVGPTALWLLLFLGVPMILVILYSVWGTEPGGVVDRSFTLENYRHFFERSVYQKILLRSFVMGLESSLIALLIAYPTAYYIANRRQGGATLIFLILVPFWTSYLVRLFAWMLILMERGAANSVLLWLGIINEPVRLLFTPFAVVIGLLYSAIHFAILPIYAVLKGIDRELVPAAKMLGANDFQAFLEVTLPLSMPGVMTALVINFISGAGSFLAPAILGGKGADLMSNVIANRFLQSFDWSFGAALAIILLVSMLLFLGVVNKYVALEKIYGPSK